MKKILILLVLFAVLLSSCGKFNPDDYPWELTESDVVPYSDNAYSLEIIEGTLTNTGCKVLISKNNDEDEYLLCGEDFSIELLGDKWYKIQSPQEYVIFPAAGWFFGNDNPNGEQDMDWSKIYGELPTGTYRIVKSFRLMTGEMGVFKDDIAYNFCVEFVIE